MSKDSGNITNNPPHSQEDSSDPLYFNEVKRNAIWNPGFRDAYYS